MRLSLRNSLIGLMGCILAIGLLCSCSRKPSSTADIPRLLSSSYKISVAPFTQPRNAYHLIAGQIPENQGLIPRDSLVTLDRDLKDVLLKDTNRQYSFIPRQNLPSDWSVAKSTNQPDAINRWIAYGREHDAQYLLVPQIFDWHEREGSEAGVTSSAHVRAEFYLINIPRQMVQSRSVYEEKQVGLVDNLLAVGEFVKRKGQWVTASDLTIEGMRKAVEDLGL